MILAFLSKLSQDKTKHVLGGKSLFLISRKHAGHQPGLGRGPTPLGRGVVPMTTFREIESGNSGFSLLKSMKNMNIKNMNAKIITSLFEI